MIKKNIVPIAITLPEIQSKFAVLQTLALDDISGTQVALTPTTEPRRPASGFIMYCDKTDSKLKVIGTSGTVTAIALP